MNGGETGDKKVLTKRILGGKLGYVPSLIAGADGKKLAGFTSLPF